MKTNSALFVDCLLLFFFNSILLLFFSILYSVFSFLDQITFHPNWISNLVVDILSAIFCSFGLSIFNYFLSFIYLSNLNICFLVFVFKFLILYQPHVLLLKQIILTWLLHFFYLVSGFNVSICGLKAIIEKFFNSFFC